MFCSLLVTRGEGGTKIVAMQNLRRYLYQVPTLSNLCRIEIKTFIL